MRAGEREIQAGVLFLRFAPERTARANDHVCAIGVHHWKAQPRPRFLVAFFLRGLSAWSVISFESDGEKHVKAVMGQVHDELLFYQVGTAVVCSTYSIFPCLLT